MAERFADGGATETERAEACQLASDAYYRKFGTDGHDSARYAAAICLCQPHGPNHVIQRFAAQAASEIPGCVCGILASEALHSADPSRAFPQWPDEKFPIGAAEGVAMARLLRDIFGKSFRPATFSPEWRTSAAVALARGMYESRDFSAMPILADALQDAGCDSADVLDHCRGPGPHVRGCWVVDLVLGKE